MRTLHRVALAAYLGLIVLIVAWEAWLAPVTPVSRGFWVGLKALPLIVTLPWLFRADARAHVLAALLLLLYFCEGVVTAYGASRIGDERALGYAAAELILTVTFIATGSLYARFRFRGEPPRARGGTES